MLGEMRGILSKVDDHVEDCSLSAAHEFRFFVRSSLEVQTTQGAA